MTNIADWSYEDVGDEHLKINSVDKTKKLQILNELSNPDNKCNVEEGSKMAPLAHTQPSGDTQPCTSTPKYSNRILSEASSAGENLGRDATLDSGFQDSSCQNSVFNFSSVNSSINESFNNSFSEGFLKPRTNKRKDSLTCSAKSRKKSPSSLSRNRLKLKANNRLNQFISNAQNCDLTRKISSNLSLNSSIETDKSSKSTPVLEQLASSHFLSGSSTHTIKSLNHSVNDTANDSHFSLVTACARITLSNPPQFTYSSCNACPTEDSSKWQQRVDMKTFQEIMKKLKPPDGVYLIGSKMAIEQYDIVSNVFQMNLFDFTTKLFWYLSNEDLTSFHQVSRTWKMAMEWNSEGNTRRLEYVRRAHDFYVHNKENVIKRSRTSLFSATTSTNSPLQLIQKTSLDTPKRKFQTSDHHDTLPQPPLPAQTLHRQRLLKCPLCSWASRVDGLKALCMKASCGLQFCSRCLQSDHAFGFCPQQISH